MTERLFATTDDLAGLQPISGSLTDFLSGDTFGAFAESGAGTDEALHLISGEHAGPHAANTLNTLAIVTRPAGSGVNGPAAADYSLTLSNIKQGWTDQNVAEQGEIDGLHVTIRQGGPTGGGSDAAGILVNAANIGDSGFLAAMEASVNNYDANLDATYTAQLQIGTWNDTANYGFVSIQFEGTQRAAFYALRQSNGAFTYPFLYEDGSIKFSVDADGIVSAGIAGDAAINPAFTFSGDEDTGIYRSASDTMRVVTGGTIRATIGATWAFNSQNVTNFAQLIPVTGGGLLAPSTAGEAATLRAWDVDGAVVSAPFLTLTSNNTPTCTLTGVTSSTDFNPTTSGGGALGTASLPWSSVRSGGLGINVPGALGASIHAYRNDTNTAQPLLLLEQDGTGDVSMQFLLTATRAWSFGIDNSDGDKLKWSPVADSFASSVMELTVAGALDVDASYSVAGTKVVGARDTGWAAMTGTPDEGTIYDTASVTLPQLAGRVMAMQAALTAHGLIGA